MNPIDTTADERIHVTDPLPARPEVSALLNPSDCFVRRHIGPDAAEVREMLRSLSVPSLETLIDQTIPTAIRMAAPLALGAPRTEHELLGELRTIAGRNKIFRSCIGLGYADCITPPVIQRNILENPGWYTQYTPYQAEISQGRLEALLVFQTMVADLTALPVANASLLDESTAAAEAMSMCIAIGSGRRRFIVDADCHPQTIAVVRTRARSLGVALEVARHDQMDLSGDDLSGVLLQYPTTDGRIIDHRELVERVHRAGGLVAMACDLLALTIITPPGELGADIAVGTTQRFGVPLGGGGPHAAFLATREAYVRKMPGRVIGVSRDARGRTVYRMAIQTREQHIKRERATSNICTAQVLLAIMAGMYAVYHGPEGLRRIAHRVNAYTRALRNGLTRLGHDAGDEPIFDTLRVRLGDGNADGVHEAAASRGVNLRRYDDGSVGVTLDETTSRDEVRDILESFAGGRSLTGSIDELIEDVEPGLPAPLARTSAILQHEVFGRYHTETELLRYLTSLQSRDLSLANSMIPLGSCTMKLNATTEMLPISWPEFARIHPFAPADQVEGYAELVRQLERWLAELTGLPAVSLQPNAGSQGEYAGLLTIRAYHEHRGEPGRDVCLIPVSAHGTNPASAVVAGYRVVPIACDAHGNIDLADLRAKAAAHADSLGALMVTYPSTHGVFEASIQEVCRIVHERGGQVYLDGANLNAQVGLCRPADLGADVCHLNLHKTFCIPHGGGGPGMGPIVAASHLAPFMPTHPFEPAGPDATIDVIRSGDAVGAISAAPYGSPGILPISWMYIALMGGAGLTQASEIAILNANYMAQRLESHYKILFRGDRGRVAHEFIIDCRSFEKSAGIRIDDVAKRLMDYGFHAPTMAWPVPGTLMIEPTESESKAELDRFCDAMIAIREEIRAIEEGRADKDDNLLRNAPHTIEMVSADEWPYAYGREEAAFPLPWLRERKFWPPVARIDNPYGDRNLVCSCPADWHAEV